MDDLTYRVLTACRGELIGLYPGLGEAFGWLEAADGEALGTDGTRLFVPPELKKLYGESPAKARRPCCIAFSTACTSTSGCRKRWTRRTGGWPATSGWKRS